MVLTNHTDDEDIISVLSHGAHAIIFESEPTETVETSIELLCRGAVVFSLPAAMVAMSEKIEPFSVPAAGASLALATTRGLTALEIQTIQLVARGHTDPEIGEMLGISRRTVERISPTS